MNSKEYLSVLNPQEVALCQAFGEILREEFRNRSTAEKFHESEAVKNRIEDVISESFEKYEPENYKDLEFSIYGDDYDNSIEIYIKNHMPYPYEPCIEIRRAIYDLGFGIVYWNFWDGGELDSLGGKKYPEEIRGTEPRRYKVSEGRSSAKLCQAAWSRWGISYPDERFDGDKWIGSKYDCRSLRKCQ